MRLTIIDFETTGLSPQSHRIIEVGAVRVENGQITGRFSQLMDPGVSVPSFVSQLTGITQDMLCGQPTPEEVMPDFHKFVGGDPVLAHNAGFDRRFMYAEFRRAGLAQPSNPILCSLLLARRLIPNLPSYKLTALAQHLEIDQKRGAHRALVDVEMTAELWNHLYSEVQTQSRLENPGIEIFQGIASQPKASTQSFLEGVSLNRQTL